LHEISGSACSHPNDPDEISDRFTESELFIEGSSNYTSGHGLEPSKERALIISGAELEAIRGGAGSELPKEPELIHVRNLPSLATE
jgi:hypothetical protein